MKLIIKNGIPLIGDDTYAEYDYTIFNKDACLNPFMIYPKENKIKLDVGAIKTSFENYSITFSYEELSY